MIGLKRGTVQLLPYNQEWKKQFEQEKRRLSHAIGKMILDIQHIGSTAIPEIPAKPIIDIAVAIKSDKEIDQLIAPLERLGYEYKGERNQDQHLFVKGSEKKRTVYLHITEFNSDSWKNYLLFRNYLRSHKKDADDYAKAKIKLANKYPQDRGSYTSGKAEFIENILKKAKNE